jgi:hypothetical protein
MIYRFKTEYAPQISRKIFLSLTVNSNCLSKNQRVFVAEMWCFLIGNKLIKLANL